MTPAEKQHWMKQAIEHAQQHPDEVPVGAVLVHQGRIIGAGGNCPLTLCDPTAHAEVIALRQACQYLHNYRLPPETILFVTVEPCTMCVGALVHARVAHVVFGAAEPRAGALISARQLMKTHQPADRGEAYFNHRFTFEGGVMAAECGELLKQFFRYRREQQRIQSKLV